jgi:hypothetical protein
MERKYFAAVIAAALLLCVSGCGAKSADTASLQEQNANLAEQIAALQKEKDTAEAHAAWVSADGAWRCSVETPEHRLWLSDSGTEYCLSYGGAPYGKGRGEPVSGTVLEAYTALTIYDVNGAETDTWLMVRYPVYSVPSIPVFWVKQSQVAPYTTENRTSARSPVSLRPGAMLITDAGKTPADSNMLESSTIIERMYGDTVHVAQAGGWTGTVSVSDIVYPDPSTFTYGGK